MSVTLGELERRLWDAANALRGPVDPAYFKTNTSPCCSGSGSATPTTGSGGLLSDRKAAAAAVDSEVNWLRRLGASWSDIGGVLGVSRQAARQKYLTQN